MYTCYMHFRAFYAKKYDCASQTRWGSQRSSRPPSWLGAPSQRTLPPLSAFDLDFRLFGFSPLILPTPISGYVCVFYILYSDVRQTVDIKHRRTTYRSVAFSLCADTLAALILYFWLNPAFCFVRTVRFPKLIQTNYDAYTVYTMPQ